MWGRDGSSRTNDQNATTSADGPGTLESTYQPGEASCLHMSYAHRRPGNYFPDRDPALAAASSAIPRTTVIID